MEDFSLYMGVYGVAEPAVTPVEMGVNLMLRFYLSHHFKLCCMLNQKVPIVLFNFSSRGVG